MAQVVGECKHQTSFKSRDSLRNGRINITPVIVRAFQKAVYMAHAKDVVEDNLGPILSLEVDFLVRVKIFHRSSQIAFYEQRSARK